MRTSRAAGENSLLSWTHQPNPHIVRFAGADDQWTHWPYTKLAERIQRVASGLRAHGLEHNDIVMLVEPTGPDFIAGYFGCQLAGMIPVPVSPLAFGQAVDGYQRHVAHIVQAAQPRLVMAAPSLFEPLQPVAGHALLVSAEQLADAGDTAPKDSPLADLAMLQFTSGSTGRPRGVRVPFSALEHNVAAIGRWLRQEPEDPTASWLPMHHDMGLIGCLITPIVHQTDLWLLPPEQFIRDPLRYLRCFGEFGARLTAMPDFGLRHIVRRVKPEQLSGLDFSQWRAVIVGAERVSHDALGDFWRLLAPYGLDRRSLLPAYGLAEGTLAVTGLALDVTWSTVEVDPVAVRLGQPVTAGLKPTEMVGCGAPLDGITVRILDDQGRPLPEGMAGEIEVGGLSVTAGYEAAPGVESSTRYVDGAIRTGDTGFLSGGELYVLGRLGDSLKLRGRTLFAEDVEMALESAGLPRHRQTVLLGQLDGPVAALIIENADEARLERAKAVVARLTEGAQLVAFSVPIGTIMRTTSGKPKRRALWRSFCTGKLEEH